MFNLHRLLFLHVLNWKTIMLFLLYWFTTGVAAGGKSGRWELLLNNTGVVAMHMALTYRNTVLFFDQTEAGPSGYILPRGRGRKECPSDSTDPSCWAHSMEYHIVSNTLRPLRLRTDTWCSSGSFFSDGTLVQTGGYGKGARKIRRYDPCSYGRCDWIESKSYLSHDRWYASNQVLPENDQMIIVGGRNVFTYEFVPKSSKGAFELPFLRQTNNRHEEGGNLYPFLHLSSDGHLFIFANRDSILFDYGKSRVVKTFPRMPGNGSRSYPSTGSSVMLPLDHADRFQKVEVMICGGAHSGAYIAAKDGNFLKGLDSCGRIVITGENHEWLMESMPESRLLHDMLILPTGDILIINGATHGSAGWDGARNPSLSPYLYRPTKKVGERFLSLKSTKIARLYHSSAILLPDGRVLVAGSNPNRHYAFNGVPFATELRLQAYVPYYMGNFFDKKRATNLSIIYPEGEIGVAYGEEFCVRFELGRVPSKVIDFIAYAPPFNTHSISMNQRMLKLKCSKLGRGERGEVTVTLVAPPSSTVAPAGYYLLTVVNGGVPSKAEWVRFIHR